MRSPSHFLLFAKEPSEFRYSVFNHPRVVCPVIVAQLVWLPGRGKPFISKDLLQRRQPVLLDALPLQSQRHVYESLEYGRILFVELDRRRL